MCRVRKPAWKNQVGNLDQPFTYRRYHGGASLFNLSSDEELAMPIQRKSAVTTSTAITITENGQHEKDRLATLRKYEGLPFPRKIVLVGILRDESDSMSVYRRPGFSEMVIKGVKDRVGERALNQVYVHLGVISDGVVHSDIAPLGKLKVPEFMPNGSTPLGTGLKKHVELAEAFFEKLFEQEVTVRHYETVIISDLKPDGESPEQSNAGITAFINHQAKYRGKTTVIGPAEAMDWMIATRLGVSKESVQPLDKADPETLLQFTLDSLTQVSRKLG
jgi:uncharacterized protein YegL